jgi:hypothetical protein
VRATKKQLSDQLTEQLNDWQAERNFQCDNLLLLDKMPKTNAMPR